MSCPQVRITTSNFSNHITNKSIDMKTKNIVLSALFLSAIASCGQQKSQQPDKWVKGDKNAKDTTINNQVYRHHGGFWYPVYHGLINPGIYGGSSINQISSPGFTPAKAFSSGSSTGSSSVRSGGFGGSSAHSSAS